MLYVYVNVNYDSSPLFHLGIQFLARVVFVRSGGLFKLPGYLVFLDMLSSGALRLSRWFIWQGGSQQGVREEIESL